MSECTRFLPPEFADMGLMAFADPTFAERLVEALRRLPPVPAQEMCAETTSAGVAVAADGLE